MRTILFGIFILLLFHSPAHAQKKVNNPVVKHLPEKKESNFGIGAGFNSSVVYLPRNTSSANGAQGRNIVFTYDRNNFIRFTFEYNKYNSPDFAPTWYNVKASSFESNIQYLTRFVGGKSLLYPMAGLSYNLFSGYFTGKNDYLNLRAIHQESTNVTSNWFGLNVGVGYDFNFRSFAFYMMYKMRIGYTEGYNQLNIQDICISTGLRFYMNKTKFNKIFLGPRSRYALPKSKLKQQPKTKPAQKTKPEK